MLIRAIVTQDLRLTSEPRPRNLPKVIADPLAAIGEQLQLTVQRRYQVYSSAA